MSEPKDKEELKEYAGGWITESRNTDIPTFLKVAFPVVGLSSVIYVVAQMYGDVGHATRGPLVAQFLKASETSPAFQYLVALMVFVFVAITTVFAFSAFKED